MSVSETSMLKRCCQCRAELDVDTSFTFSRYSADGYEPRCRPCAGAKRAAWRARTGYKTPAKPNATSAAARAWRQNHKERAAAYDRVKYFRKRGDKQREAAARAVYSALVARDQAARMAARKAERAARSSDLALDRAAVRFAHRAARRRQLDLTVPAIRELLRPLKCTVTGAALTLGGRTPLSTSLDRVDASKPYTADNVRLVSLQANCALNEWDGQAFHDMVRSYCQHHFGVALPEASPI